MKNIASLARELLVFGRAGGILEWDGSNRLGRRIRRVERTKAGENGYATVQHSRSHYRFRYSGWNRRTHSMLYCLG